MNNKFIKNSNDLITSKEDTRAGFIAMALEKNYLAIPYIEEAKALKTFASKASSPKDLKEMKEIRPSLLSASGISDKALLYLKEEDEDVAINGLIEKFLEPAGKSFADELVYRYLLIKGDALGGKARNLAGSIGERKFLRTFLSVLNIMKVSYTWLDSEDKQWKLKPKDDIDIEKRIKAISWTIDKKDRVLVLNIKVPIVGKNVDLCLLNGSGEHLILNGSKTKDSIHKNNEAYIGLGELKCGIDPAGADEHWKTANSALNRIRESFESIDMSPSTYFIGAAIENSMATEIYKQLEENIMTNAANLHNEDQLVDLCDWLLKE